MKTPCCAISAAAGNATSGSDALRARPLSIAFPWIGKRKAQWRGTRWCSDYYPGWRGESGYPGWRGDGRHRGPGSGLDVLAHELEEGALVPAALVRDLLAVLEEQEGGVACGAGYRLSHLRQNNGGAVLGQPRMSYLDARSDSTVQSTFPTFALPSSSVWTCPSRMLVRIRGVHLN